MKEPIRVLQVLGTTGLGGAESRVMDLYRNIDRERVQFDFAVHTSKKGYFDEEIEALGGHIYRLPRFRVYNWIPYRAAWRSEACENRPDSSPCQKRGYRRRRQRDDDEVDAKKSLEKNGRLPGVLQACRKSSFRGKGVGAGSCPCGAECDRSG